jgi:hypothetical protein
MYDSPGVSRPARTGAAHPLWVRGFAWDAFWLQSALWLVPLALVLAQDNGDPGDNPLDLLVFALTCPVLDQPSIGFVVAGLCDNRVPAAVRAEPTRFVVVPIVIAAACFALLLPGDEALPFTRPSA